MKHIFISVLFVAAFLVALGCTRQADHVHDDHESELAHSDQEHDGHAHDHSEDVVIETLWQDNLEMFGEWAPFIAGQTSNAVLHFTSMLTFEPATQGPLTINWLNGGRVVKSQVADTVARTGIFIVEISPPDAGTYELTMTLASSQMTGTVRLQNVQVYQGHAPHPPHEEGGGEEEISFLKEQQWMLGTKTGLVERRDLYDNLRAPGELKPAGSKTSEVFAPFSGTLQPDHRTGAVRHGQHVRKGQALALISASASAENSWFQLLGEYRLAKAELNRVEKLFDQKAAPERRLDEARQELAIKQAQLSAALGGAELVDVDSDSPQYTLRAPRDGVIAHHDVGYGSFVQPGQRLFSIVDPDVVWMEVQVAAADMRKTADVRGAFFTIGGEDNVHSTADFDGKVIASGSVLDPVTRRVPITFELDNREGVLKVGEFVQAELQTSAARSTLAVQKSAILEDGGASVAYVQKSGESWARRVVTTGAADGPWVEVLAGLNEGERVAIAGAYKIKLASGKTGEVGHGHAH